MFKQKLLIGVSLSAVVALTGCVSEKSYVGTDKPVTQRNFDNIEAARTRISLGLNYLRRGDTSQAKYNLERARSFAPNSAEVHSALAYYYQSVGENKQAEEYFRIAISKDVNYADAYNNYGAFLCQLQRYDEAEQLLLKAISRPGYIRVAESYENLALCQLQQNNFTKASGYLEQSISHNTTRITSLTMAAGLAYAMGDNRQAKARLDRVQRLGRVSARTVLLSYLIAEKNGDRETQRNAEQLLLTLYTDTPETRLLLQGKTQDSEFELLRERYKDSLMANIVVPDSTALNQPVPAKPVANPKLKVVKRKTAEGEVDTAEPAPVRPRTERSNTASAIAGALAANTAVPPAVVQEGNQQPEAPGSQIDNGSTAQPALTSAAAVPQPLPVEAMVAGTSPAEPETVSTETSTVLAEAETLAEPETSVAKAGIAADMPAEEAAPAAPAVASVATADTATDADDTAEPEFSAATAADTGLFPDTEPFSDTEALSYAEPAVAAADSSESETPFHIVQASESLYAISVKHNIRLPRLMEWNQLTPESVIKTGQKIWLGPVAAEQLNVVALAATERELVQATEPFHVVASGETMFAISYRYNIRLDKFMSWNGLTENSTLRVGQRVYVVDPVSVTQ